MALQPCFEFWIFVPVWFEAFHELWPLWNLKRCRVIRFLHCGTRNCYSCLGVQTLVTGQWPAGNDWSSGYPREAFDGLPSVFNDWKDGQLWLASRCDNDRQLGWEERKWLSLSDNYVCLEARIRKATVIVCGKFERGAFTCKGHHHICGDESTDDSRWDVDLHSTFRRLTAMIELKMIWAFRYIDNKVNDGYLDDKYINKSCNVYFELKNSLTHSVYTVIHSVTIFLSIYIQ